MLSYDKVKENPSVLLAFTTLERPEFEQLLIAFTKAWHEIENKPRAYPRKRKRGGGRKSKLSSMADRLLFILFYWKTYPIQEVLAFMFGMSQAQANDWIHRLSKVLKKALGKGQYLPERDGKRLAQTIQDYETLAFVQDGTERRRQRPKDEKEQKAYYSGKKKAHTLKNHLVVHPENRRVCFLGQTVAGKKHDKKLADEEELEFPSQATLEQDTGFQGYVPDEVILLQPKKKPRGKELTTADKFINRCISSGRIIVENVLAGIKRCCIVKDIYRQGSISRLRTLTIK